MGLNVNRFVVTPTIPTSTKSEWFFLQIRMICVYLSPAFHCHANWNMNVETMFVQPRLIYNVRHFGGWLAIVWSWTTTIKSTDHKSYLENIPGVCLYTCVRIGVNGCMYNRKRFVFHSFARVCVTCVRQTTLYVPMWHNRLLYLGLCPLIQQQIRVYVFFSLLIVFIELDNREEISSKSLFSLSPFEFVWFLGFVFVHIFATFVYLQLYTYIVCILYDIFLFFSYFNCTYVCVCVRLYVDAALLTLTLTSFRIYMNARVCVCMFHCETHTGTHTVSVHMRINSRHINRHNNQMASA